MVLSANFCNVQVWVAHMFFYLAGVSMGDDLLDLLDSAAL